jgi:hypothetical protein
LISGDNAAGMGDFGAVLILGAAGLAAWLFGNPLPRVLATATWRGHLLFALLLGFVAGIGLLSLSAGRYYQLDRGGTHVEGVVTAKEPQNHRLIRYRYSAAGHEYAGTGSGGYGNPDFDGLRVGDRLRVVYLTTSPGLSTAGDPHARFLGELQSAGVIGLLVSGGAFWGMRRKKRAEPVRVNGWRVVGMTLLILGVIEGVGCIIPAAELARGHPIGPLLCGFFTLVLLGFGAYAIRVARRKGRSA